MPVPRPPFGRRTGIDCLILRCCPSAWRCDCPLHGCFRLPTPRRREQPVRRSSPPSPRLTTATVPEPASPLILAGRRLPAGRTHSGCREGLPRRRPQSSPPALATDLFRRRPLSPRRQPSGRRPCGLAWGIRSSRLPSGSTVTERWHRASGWRIAIGFAAPTCSCQGRNCDCPDAVNARPHAGDVSGHAAPANGACERARGSGMS